MESWPIDAGTPLAGAREWPAFRRPHPTTNQLEVTRVNTRLVMIRMNVHCTTVGSDPSESRSAVHGDGVGRAVAHLGLVGS